MSAAERMRRIRIINKIKENKKFSEKLGIRDTSYLRESKERQGKQDEHD